MREWLKRRRLESGLTQEDVAKSSDIERAYYNMIENGSRKPSVDVAKRIAATLEFEWTIFFEDKVTL